MKNQAGTKTSTTSAAQTNTVDVETVEQLYAAVDDSANAGKTIVLKRGTYVLSRSETSGNIVGDRGNLGRLELQNNMSLLGRPDEPSAVVIDTTSEDLQDSFNAKGGGRLGTIRTGRGSHAIEGLTIKANPLSAASIATDLEDREHATPFTEIRVANVISIDQSGGYATRGVDVRNIGVAPGRKISARIENCQFSGGMQGIRIANFDTPNGEIEAKMNGNRSFDNKTGCIIANNRSGSARIDVQSDTDRFENNGVGCWIIGALGVGKFHFRQIRRGKVAVY